ncbi:unnamed protein product, partial [Staurois parvus]
CSALLCRTRSSILPVPQSSSVLLPSAIFSPRRRHLQCDHPAACGFKQGAHCTCARSAALCEWPHSLVCSLWSSPVLCPQSLVISCTVSAVSGHLLYCVRSLWSSPVLCPQSLVISCTIVV